MKNRKRLLFSLVIVIAITLIAAGLVLGTQRAKPTSGVLTLALSDQQHATSNEQQVTSNEYIFGVQMRDQIDESQGLAQAVTAGVRWVRVNLSWREIEPEWTDPPTYHWERYDTMFDNAAQAGLRVIATIRDNPTWAAETICGPIASDRLPDFARFLTDLAARYGEEPYHIYHWELYNEPDNTDLKHHVFIGGCWGEHPEAYVEMLKTAYPAIKAGNPKAQVLFGGIAFESWPGSPFAPDFLEQVLKADAGDYFDVMNFHYYPAFAETWNPYGPGVRGKAAYMRQELARFGLDKPLVLTEVGQPTAGPAEDNQNYSDLSSARQVVRAFVQGYAADLQVVIWFTMVDYPPDPRKYGLLHADLTPKPAYRAYVILTRQLAGQRYVRPLEAAELGADDLEGYLFRDVTGSGGDMVVVWANGEAERPLRLVGKAVQVTHWDGATRQIVDDSSDDQDGRADGIVTMLVGADPIYIGLEEGS